MITTDNLMTAWTTMCDADWSDENDFRVRLTQFRATFEQWEREHGTIWIVERDNHATPRVLELRECPAGSLSDGWVSALFPYTPAHPSLVLLAQDAQESLLADVARAQAEAVAAPARRDEAVRAALAGRVPVRQITARTGLSRQRVYQIRDGVR